MFSNVLEEGMSCFQAVIKRELESFLLYKCNDGKELYKKKSDAPAKVVVLRIPTYYFFNLLLASALFVAYALQQIA